MELLDGKLTAKQFKEEIAKEVEGLKTSGKKAPLALSCLPRLIENAISGENVTKYFDFLC